MTSDTTLQILAAEALGWKFDPKRGNKTYPWWEPERDEVIHGFECKKSSSHAMPPQPLTSYADAFALVNRAREEGYVVRIDLGLNSHVRFHKTANRDGRIVSEKYEATDPDPKRAITVAALKMWGKL